MLTYLGVRNLTVIEKAGLEFGPGLNVITGETGAGKSVLVGALKFLTGERFSRAVLRDPKKKLAVEGIFAGTEHIDGELREQYEIGDELILSRESDEAGRSRVFINGHAAPVTKLREASEYLIDIHGQHENQFLFNPAKHLDFLDFFVDQSLKENYRLSYAAYREKAAELASLKKRAEETARLKEMYEFQLEEISSLNIDPEKDGRIDEQIEFLSHIEKIREATAQCLNLLKEGEISAADLVGRAERSLSGIFSLAPELAKAAENLAAASSYINDAVSYIESVFEGQESSPDELNALIDRKYKLQNLLKKYGSGLREVLAYKEGIAESLENAALGGERISAVEREAAFLEKKALEDALKLNEGRKKAAFGISERVCQILKELELPSSRFLVKFIEGESLDRSGGISAEFYISTNAGFEPGPLSSVASGGEISRVMLALKEVFAEADSIGTLLFDEIDTGISGRAAKSVAGKLKKLSRTKQIIVITHLPVVAAQGDIHFHISKSDSDGLSRTDILKLENKTRENVIATMIAGEVTEPALLQARELLKGAVG